VTDDEQTAGEKIEAAIGQAISDAISRFEGGYAIKWVAGVEMMETGGDRGVWSFTSPDATRWDVMGLLAELEHRQTAHTLYQHLNELGEQE
jgi:hypothetical protein